MRTRKGYIAGTTLHKNSSKKDSPVKDTKRGGFDKKHKKTVKHNKDNKHVGEIDKTVASGLIGIMPFLGFQRKIKNK